MILENRHEGNPLVTLQQVPATYTLQRVTGKRRTYPFRDEGGKVCNRRSPLIDRRRAEVGISMSQPPLIQRRSRPCEQFHPKL